MRTIGSLPNLSSLALTPHGITDDDLSHLLTLRDLRHLKLLLSGVGCEISLTDASLTFIATTFPKLESLSICFNRKITIAGIRRVILSCPLRTDLGPEHLENIVRDKRTLKFIRYGWACNKMNEKLFRKASIASQGRCLFVGMNHVLYEPTFDSNLFANHNATKTLITDMEASESLLYDD
jgi:hypothetical protein